jgi:hypothetical protein
MKTMRHCSVIVMILLLPSCATLPMKPQGYKTVGGKYYRCDINDSGAITYRQLKEIKKP